MVPRTDFIDYLVKAPKSAAREQRTRIHRKRKIKVRLNIMIMRKKI